MTERDNSYLVLVVDDSECHREILSVFLGVLGYKVVEAADGLEAVKIARSLSPDLIIMDLSMPVMDGYGAVQILRKVPETSAVPILACTAHDISTQKAQAMSAGFNDVLTKPIDFTRLNVVIDRFLKAA